MSLKKQKDLLLWLPVVFLWAVLPAGAQQVPPERLGQEELPAQKEQAQETDKEQLEKKEAVPLPIYIPPPRGTPKTRVGAATRGPREDFPRLEVLAPDHAGLTLAEQPRLSWYLSGQTGTRIDLALIDDASVKPLLEMTLTAPVTGGVHTLRLEDYGLRLEEGRIYQWFVALVPDPIRRSNDILASGAIQRVEGTDTLRRELASVAGLGRVELLARRGLWYDAIAALSDLIESDPTSPQPLRARAALLEQIGLGDLALRLTD